MPPVGEPFLPSVRAPGSPFPGLCRISAQSTPQLLPEQEAGAIPRRRRAARGPASAGKSGRSRRSGPLPCGVTPSAHPPLPLLPRRSPLAVPEPGLLSGFPPARSFAALPFLAKFVQVGCEGASGGISAPRPAPAGGGGRACVCVRARFHPENCLIVAAPLPC